VILKKKSSEKKKERKKETQSRKKDLSAKVLICLFIEPLNGLVSSWSSRLGQVTHQHENKGIT